MVTFSMTPVEQHGEVLLVGRVKDKYFWNSIEADVGTLSNSDRRPSCKGIVHVLTSIAVAFAMKTGLHGARNMELLGPLGRCEHLQRINKYRTREQRVVCVQSGVDVDRDVPGDRATRYSILCQAGVEETAVEAGWIQGKPVERKTLNNTGLDPRVIDLLAQARCDLDGFHKPVATLPAKDSEISGRPVVESPSGVRSQSHDIFKSIRDSLNRQRPRFVRRKDNIGFGHNTGWGLVGDKAVLGGEAGAGTGGSFDFVRGKGAQYFPSLRWRQKNVWGGWAGWLRAWRRREHGVRIHEKCTEGANNWSRKSWVR
ncbi:hypothetical protein DFH08DRAFT_836470 [Mycena albidolilacea]|uniref:Uncharacterized protein n=1 Tax=Mycena albidolilacea TaxID=1033008 RepID=A0AAD7ASC0_9AGAR|nr:hypothetical protein DFH08DRAFT_836470 [Mycena albidolilacea]